MEIITYTYTIPVDNITDAPSTKIVLRSDGLYIPTDPANSDYQDYLIWVAEGNQATSLDRTRLSDPQG